MHYVKFYLMDNLKEISLALTTQSTQASGGGKGRRMVGEEGGCGKGGRKNLSIIKNKNFL